MNNNGATENNGIRVKILTIGDSGVGKTCLIMRFSGEEFVQSFITTVGIDYKRKIIQLEDTKYYQLTIWDTAGQERFRTITQAYFRGAHGMLLVFDVGSEKTFKSVEHWMDQIGDHVKKITKDNEYAVPPKVILVGNKADIPDNQRQVTKERAQEMADKWGIGYIETSAKDNTNVQEAFMTITKLVAPTLSLGDSELGGGRTNLAEVGSSEKKGCAC